MPNDKAYIETKSIEAKSAASAIIAEPENATIIAKKMAMALPETAGVYYFYNEQGGLLYIGKSINLRKRVLSHFYTAKREPREQKLMHSTHQIQHRCCPGELSALLLESQEVKKHSPIFNRRLRRQKTLFSWQLKKSPYPTQQSKESLLYPELIEASWPPPTSTILYGLYKNRTYARKQLEAMAYKESLCKKLLGLEKTQNACFGYQLKKCSGCCIGEESLSVHNKALEQALSHQVIEHWPFKNAIGIIENSISSHINVINEWQYLGNSNTIKKAKKLVQTTHQETLLDRDQYNIVLGFVMKPRTDIEIIHL